MHRIKGALLVDYGEPIRIAELTVEEPGPGEVLVEIRASGVCRTDWHAVTGHLPLPVPLVLGHEGAGIVKDIGSGVQRVKPGDHVVLSWIPNCGNCRWCILGRPELCDVAITAAVNGTLPSGVPRLFWGDDPISCFSSTGTLADLAVVSELSAIVIPDYLPFDQAALLGCAVQTGVGAAFRSPLAAGDTVLVIGAGGVGLNIIQGAQIRGAAHIIAVDPSEVSRRLAEQFGAHTTINPLDEDPLLAILDLTDGLGVDVAFEAVGQGSLIALAFNATRPGGTTVAVGVPTPNESITLNAFAFPSQEKTLTGSWYGGSYPLRDVPRLIALWESGQLQIEPLIQRRYSLLDCPQAFDDLQAGRGGRSVITW